MKFSPDQLDMKEGELANLIDKATANDSIAVVQPERKKENEGSKSTKIFKKRINEVTLLSRGDDFTLIDGGEMTLKFKTNRIVFGFYMISFKSVRAAQTSFTMRFNGRDMPETRQSIGNVKQSTVTGAFAEVFTPNDKEITVGVFYNAPQEVKIRTDSGEMNLSYGAITFLEGNVFKHINSADLEFAQAPAFAMLPNFDLNIRHEGESEAYYLIMYNLSIPLAEDSVFSARLNYNNLPIEETTASVGSIQYPAVQSGIVLKVKPGSSTVKLEYTLGGKAFTLTEFNDPRFSQSLTAFQLPDSATVTNYRLTQPMVLNTNGEWKQFNLGCEIEIVGKPKTVFIIFQINLKIDDKGNNQSFSARIKAGNKFNKKSVIATAGLMNASATGYVANVFKPGKYSFDIGFKSDSPQFYNPEMAHFNGEGVNMQVILLD